MKHLQDIERAVERLSPAELAEFRRWFLALESGRWDREVEQDVPPAGRFDHIAEDEMDEIEEMFGERRRQP